MSERERERGCVCLGRPIVGRKTRSHDKTTRRRSGASCEAVCYDVNNCIEQDKTGPTFAARFSNRQ